MSLSLEQNTQPSAKSSKSAALLNKYLKEAVHLTYSDTLFEANRYLSDFATRPHWEEIKREDIDAKRKEIKEDLKKFGFREKAAYYANVRSAPHLRETMVKMGIAAVTTAVATAVSPELGQAVAGAAVAYGMSKLIAGTAFARRIAGSAANGVSVRGGRRLRRPAVVVFARQSGIYGRYGGTGNPSGA